MLPRGGFDPPTREISAFAILRKPYQIYKNIYTLFPKVPQISVIIALLKYVRGKMVGDERLELPTSSV